MKSNKIRLVKVKMNVDATGSTLTFTSPEVPVNGKVLAAGLSVSAIKAATTYAASIKDATAGLTAHSVTGSTVTTLAYTAIDNKFVVGSAKLSVTFSAAQDAACSVYALIAYEEYELAEGRSYEFTI